jgi:hypothetical protein
MELNRDANGLIHTLDDLMEIRVLRVRIPDEITSASENGVDGILNARLLFRFAFPVVFLLIDRNTRQIFKE